MQFGDNSFLGSSLIQYFKETLEKKKKVFGLFSEEREMIVGEGIWGLTIISWNQRHFDIKKCVEESTILFVTFLDLFFFFFFFFKGFIVVCEKMAGGCIIKKKRETVSSIIWSNDDAIDTSQNAIIYFLQLSTRPLSTLCFVQDALESRRWSALSYFDSFLINDRKLKCNSHNVTISYLKHLY